MSNPVVLTEKLRRPEPAGLSRKRLEAPLLEGTTSRLHLVVAPPGSGKTTLLARVAAAATVSSPVAWYRVTGDDAAEPTMVAHLGRALRDTLGISVTEPTMAGVLEALEDWSGNDAVIILDDLHEIAGTAAEHSLEQFVQLRPHSLRVLVGSRRQPEMNIPRLRVSNVLHEISSDDLRFRSWEVEDLFTSVFREPLSPESAAALTRRTGGWAAGLQLFHLATAGRSAAERKRAVDDLGGRSKLVRSYLARNVLAELPEDRRQFLLRTCTLGSLTGALCDALLETTGSRRVLDELEQQQLFTSSEDDGETFRYHEVLRTHLEWALVEEYGAAGARRWYSRSAALLESIGDQRAAVRAYARAEDWGAVARMIQTRGTGPDATVAGADFLLPATVVEHDPWLSLAEARRRVREGALSAAVVAYRQAEALLDEPEFRASCRRERSAASLWAVPPLGLSGWVSAAPTEARHWSAVARGATRRSVDVAAGPGTGGSGETLARGICALLAGEFAGARTLLDSIEHDGRADSTFRLLASLASTAIDLVTIGCADPSARLGQIALDAELAGLPWVARLSRGLGEAVLVALGSPAWRVTACTDLLVECERTGDDWGAALLQLATAIACQFADSGSADQFADAARRFQRLDAPVLTLWAQALQACVLAREGADGAGEFAHQVATGARALQSGGVHALALAALAVAAGDERRPARIVVGDAAHSVGVRGAMRLLTGATSARAAAAEDISPSVIRMPDPFSLVAEATAGTDGTSQVDPAVGEHTVRIRCFGGFALEIDGRSMDLGPLRPRARALLRLLSMTADRDAHREYLVDALWPGVDLTIGTRRLQVAVSSVRQLLEHNGLSGQDLLARRGDAYRLTLPAGGSVDVRDFEQAIRDATAAVTRGDTLAGMTLRQSALSLYRGDLLPEDGPAEYVVSERDRLRLAAASTAATLAQDSRAQGHPRQALAAARQSLQLDRFQDLAWRLLVELHEEAGDSSAAARARHEQAQAHAELGVPVPDNPGVIRQPRSAAQAR